MALSHLRFVTGQVDELFHIRDNRTKLTSCDILLKAVAQLNGDYFSVYLTYNFVDARKLHSDPFDNFFTTDSASQPVTPTSLNTRASPAAFLLRNRLKRNKIRPVFSIKVTTPKVSPRVMNKQSYDTSPTTSSDDSGFEMSPTSFTSPTHAAPILQPNYPSTPERPPAVPYQSQLFPRFSYFQLPEYEITQVSTEQTLTSMYYMPSVDSKTQAEEIFTELDYNYEQTTLYCSY